MSEGFLSKAYTARTGEQTRRLYDDWAATYEAEVGENGYATPRRCAEALAAHLDDKSLPVLDFGCGTGLSGLAFRRAGFETLDGVDLSADMLEKAAAKGIYRRLDRIEPGAEPLHRPGDYAAIAAVGVIGAGAAPVAVFDQIMDSLAPGGLMVFSFNDHALEDPANEAAVAAWTDSDRACERFREYGDHLPGIGIGSTVYVVERM
jgi:predicted TPR repeat methyltransferase